MTDDDASESPLLSKPEKYGYLEQLTFHLLRVAGPMRIKSIRRYIHTDNEVTMGTVLARMQKQGLVHLDEPRGEWIANVDHAETIKRGEKVQRTWVDGYLLGFRNGYMERKNDE